jgi:DNA-binding NtrC family response regulator
LGNKRPDLGSDALAALQNYAFPGNVRELKNIIEHALIKSGGAAIRPEHLHLLSDPGAPVQPAAASGTDTRVRAAEELERRWQLVVKRAQKPSSREQALRQSGARDSLRSTGREASPGESPTSLTDEEKIYARVKQHGSINNAECRQLLSSGRDHASYLLRKLHGYGLLIREGDRRWARYHLP